MQKYISLHLVLAVVLILTATVAAAIPPVSLQSARVRLAPITNVGDSGQPRISGRAAVIDNSQEVVVRALATGLDPKQSYVSLFYDDSSVASGPNACTGDALFIGEWVVDDSGRGRLDSAQTTSLRLDGFGTMSIRRVTKTGLELQACGRIARR